MQYRHLAILALTVLSACTLSDDIPFEKKMSLDSETCRAESQSELSQRDNVNGESMKTRVATFEKSYRRCMAAKGYDLSAKSEYPE